MMRCIKLLQTGEIYRLDEMKAFIMVDSGQAVYVKKDIWKKAGRKTIENLNKKEKEKV